MCFGHICIIILTQLLTLSNDSRKKAKYSKTGHNVFYLQDSVFSLPNWNLLRYHGLSNLCLVIFTTRNLFFTWTSRSCIGFSLSKSHLFTSCNGDGAFWNISIKSFSRRVFTMLTQTSYCYFEYWRKEQSLTFVKYHHLPPRTSDWNQLSPCHLSGGTNTHAANTSYHASNFLLAIHQALII